MTRATCDQLQLKIEKLQAEYQHEIENNQASRHQNQVLAAELRDREWKLQETIAELQEQIRRQQAELDQQEKQRLPQIDMSILDDSQVSQPKGAHVITPPSTGVLTQSQVSSNTETPKHRGVSLMKFSESILLQDLSNKFDVLDGKENRKNNAVAVNSLHHVLVPRFK
ncbi:hypothetical protein EON65_04310 [archaeon]|nr:MAG: hypothetical protein EON65_04310 [archaeon]